eukprot:COSAG02_NODE_11413_length_1729_cov_0.899387_3_plen_232_part_00
MKLTLCYIDQTVYISGVNHTAKAAGMSVQPRSTRRGPVGGTWPRTPSASSSARSHQPSSAIGDSPDSPGMSSGARKERRAARQARSPNRSSAAARRLFHDDASRPDAEMPARVSTMGLREARVAPMIAQQAADASSLVDGMLQRRLSVDIPVSPTASSSAGSAMDPLHMPSPRQHEAMLRHIDRNQHGIAERERLAGVTSPTKHDRVKDSTLSHHVQELRRAKTVRADAGC